MKKIILVFVLLFGISLAFNFKSNAGCEVDLPNQLQACFNSQQINLNVTVDNDYAYVSGSLTSAQIGQAQNCINTYNSAAASCAGAPVLEIQNVSVGNTVSNGLSNPSSGGGSKAGAHH